MEPLQAALHHAFTYDPSEPLAFRWKIKPKKSRVAIGDIAGYWHPVRAGSPVLQRYIDVARRRIAVHRAVWIYHHGKEPSRLLEFRDGNRGECRLENLVERVPIHVEHGSYHKGYRSRFSDDEWQALCARNAMRTLHKITPEEYAEVLAHQHGRCAICGKEETIIRLGRIRLGRKDRLAIDHCHTTGEIRGLLCGRCNSGLGQFLDNPTLLKAAAAYLESKPHPLLCAATEKKKAPRAPTSSGERNISFDPANQKWRVKVIRNGRMLGGRRYGSLDEAIVARDSILETHR